MSFRLGAFNTDSIPGFKAILKEWPALPVDIRLEELPGGDGALYSGAHMESTEWEFNLGVYGTDFNDVMAKADAISKAINPLLRGEQAFTPNGFEGWSWRGVAKGAINWERDQVIWFSSKGASVLKGTITIVTPDPYGYKEEPVVTVPAPGGMLSLVSTGNAGFHPIIEFRGVLSSSQEFSVGGFTVTGPLTASQVLVLDFQNMEFYIKTAVSGAKLRNVGDRITSFVRLFGIDSLNLPVFTSAGTFTQVVGRVNSRRV